MHSCTKTQWWNSTAWYGQDLLLRTATKGTYSTSQPWSSPRTGKVKLFSLVGTPTRATPFCYAPTTSTPPRAKSPVMASPPLPQSIPYYFSTQGMGLVLLPSPLLPAALFSLAATGLVLIEAGPLRKACMAMPGCVEPLTVPSATDATDPSGPAGPSRQLARARGRGHFRPPSPNRRARWHRPGGGGRWRHAARASEPEGRARGGSARRARGGRCLGAAARAASRTRLPAEAQGLPTNASSRKGPRVWNEQKEPSRERPLHKSKGGGTFLCSETCCGPEIGPAPFPWRLRCLWGLWKRPRVKWSELKPRRARGWPGAVLTPTFPSWASVLKAAPALGAAERTAPPGVQAQGCWWWSEAKVNPLCFPIISNDIHHS